MKRVICKDRRFRIFYEISDTLYTLEKITIPDNHGWCHHCGKFILMKNIKKHICKERIAELELTKRTYKIRKRRELIDSHRHNDQHSQGHYLSPFRWG